ncbi:MAG: hypothetical protein RBR02_09575 [Desulfuromonadaceae bacterium]|nr:hypothetical protein [Desulfuromonadaceae bacterium]
MKICNVDLRVEKTLFENLFFTIIKTFVFLIIVFYVYSNHQRISILERQISYLSPKVIEIPENSSSLILEPLETRK